MHTLDNDTFASTPGMISFKPGVWFKHDRKKIISLVLFLLTSVLFGFFVTKIAFLFVPVACYMNWYYWIAASEHFTADSNGGIVISKNPTLVAVSTNLAKFGGDYPVIKVIEYKPSKFVRVGDRIGTIAVYEAHEDDDGESFINHWVDFEPIPIDYATDDRSEIRREIARYSDEQWEDIESGVSQLTKPYSPGLYRVHIADSDWCTTSR
ncbi:DUF3239 domain-containing protein [Corallincola platygyrae]|uniref:DUF3239 domain-containing protein n=1 Tax=Corallincola platygyrae TaxID=1193278 RepID=A0ABW4XKX5_9GAMM